ncbi:MAG TPA: G1 family glutamic endopeptidase [Candidatus Dormibacteraeota bacterium]|nr:G1 family glutamic endopeptidase [Candidatus Dormibacteraeota bacterium]
MKKNAAMEITIIAILALPMLAALFANSLQPVFSNPMVPVPGYLSTTSASGIISTVSYNWAGYAVTTSGTNKVTDVKGSWMVPTYSGATCNANEWWDSSFWIGIDGEKSSTVEQIGTETMCFEGVVSYDAWFEFFPRLSVTIPDAISPGDTVSAEVKWISGTIFTLSIKDTTAGWTFIKTGSLSGALRNSAEWIAESPYGLLGELPLAPFGTAYFTSDTAVTTNHSGAIGTFTAGVYLLNGVCYPSASPIKLSTSTLSNAGANFNVAYLNPGPEG